MTNDTTRTFIRLLERGIKSARNLYGTLSDEQEALRAGDPEAIEAITRRKQTLVAELDDWVVVHNTFLTELELPEGLEGTERLLDYLADDPQAEKLWSEFRELTDSCRKLNEVNGAIIALNQRQVRQSLEILRGVTPRAANTYGRGGETHSLQTSHSIGKA